MEAARKTLTRCVERAEGVGLIVGPSGTGKTLLCRILAGQFRGAFNVALLSSGGLGPRRALLQAILYELGQPCRGMDEGELRLSLVEHLTSPDKSPQGMVLLVDEAQALSLRLLDEIRALTNLVHNDQPRVRLVVAGNRVLEERFASPKLDSLTQRVVARCYLESFNRSETQEYIHALIAAAGAKGPRLFPGGVLQQRLQGDRRGAAADQPSLRSRPAAGLSPAESGRSSRGWSKRPGPTCNNCPPPGTSSRTRSGTSSNSAAWRTSRPTPKRPMPAKGSDGDSEQAASDGQAADAEQAEAETDAEPSTPSLHVVPEIDESEAAELEPSEQLQRIQQMFGGRRTGVFPGRHDRPRGRVGLQRAGTSLPRVVPGRRSDSRPLRDPGRSDCGRAERGRVKAGRGVPGGGGGRGAPGTARLWPSVRSCGGRAGGGNAAIATERTSVAAVGIGRGEAGDANQRGRRGSLVLLGEHGNHGRSAGGICDSVRRAAAFATF